MRDAKKESCVREIERERERVRDWVVENGGTELWKKKYSRAIARTFCPRYT